MSLLLFKYFVPSLLGYALFVGISGQLNPLFRPEKVSERVNWLIGLWTGLSIALVLMLALHMAYGMSVSGVRRLIGPTTWLLLTLTLPALLTYVAYRSTQRNTNSDTTRQRMDLALETPLFKPDTHEFRHVPAMNQVTSTPGSDDTEHQDEACGVVATFLDTAQLTLVDTQESPAAINDESLDQNQPDTHASEVESAALAARLDEITTRLSHEMEQRKDAETHLLVLRKALYVMDRQTREQNRERIDIHLELEESLAQRIRSEAASSAMAVSEEHQRIKAESELRTMKASLTKAQEELKTHSLSRTRALDTARKATQLARYSNTARRQLEDQFDREQLKLDSRQETISRLLTTLEAQRMTESDGGTRSATPENEHSKTRLARKRARPRLS